jgi:hypothetical protein
MAGKANPATRDQDVTDVTSMTPPTPFAQMIRAMATEASAEDDSRFSGDDLTAIIEANSEDELWESDERPPLNAQHLAGCVVEILDVDVKYSRGSRDDIQTPFVHDGKKMYLLVTAVRVNENADNAALIKLPKVGEVFTFNTSARFFTTKLWQFYVRGYIDRDNGRRLKALIRETKLDSGEGVLKLRPAPPNS